MPGAYPTRWQILALGIAIEGGMGVLAWPLGRLLGQPALGWFSWNPPDALLGVLACLPMLGVFVICLRWPRGPLARIRRFSIEVIRPLFAPCTVLDLALLSVLAGVGEETLFRGVLQGAFSQWLGSWAGLALASVLFGLLHPITPTYAVMAGFLGAYLGLLWAASGNLLAPVVAHGLYDFIALLVLVRGPVAGRPNGVTTGPGIL